MTEASAWAGAESSAASSLLQIWGACPPCLPGSALPHQHGARLKCRYTCHGPEIPHQESEICKMQLRLPLRFFSLRHEDLSKYSSAFTQSSSCTMLRGNQITSTQHRGQKASCSVVNLTFKSSNSQQFHFLVYRQTNKIGIVPSHHPR